MHVNPAIAELLQGLNNPSLPGIELSLARMEALLAALGNPERKLPPVIHIAGTNGKGSTQAYLRHIYGRAGYRVHAYTSPHLVQFNERIVLAGAMIGDDVLLGYLQRVTALVPTFPVTFFEATTAAAFLAFSEIPADVLLLEVGLGGRLDATNLAQGVVASVLTPIAMDHAEFLGETLEAIAAEKAGILRTGVPCVVAPQSAGVMAVLQQVATQRGALLLPPSPMELPEPGLAGPHQYQNAAVAAAVVTLLQDRLPVAEEVCRQAIATTQWPARLQLLRHGPLVAAWNGPVMLDGGHNPHAAQALANALAGQELVMIVGMMARKDAVGFFAAFTGRVRRVICIPVPDAPDGAAPDLLAEAARSAGLNAQTAETLEAAVAALHSVENTTLLVAGSLYLAGHVLKTNS